MLWDGAGKDPGRNWAHHHVVHQRLKETSAVPNVMTNPPDALTPNEAVIGGRIDAIGVSQHAGERQLLHAVSVSLEPGTLTAVIGGSGAGKTTLLKVLAGLRAPSDGKITHDGVSIDTVEPVGSGIGYVPQDDIIHLEMPLRRTLQYAARLRLPAGTSAQDADRVVDETMRELDLADRGNVPVRQLSGGQRKRASIAVELLTRPRIFFLDEPTSGLDPATAGEVLAVLRRLARRGVTIVLTTHEPASIERCDQVIVLARDGHLAFAGSPAEARGYFQVGNVHEVYDRLATEDTPRTWAERFSAHRGSIEPSSHVAAARPPRSGGPGSLRQWWLLTRRNAEVLVRNRLTLAVLLGSPVLVTAMMATLFRPGAFDSDSSTGVGPVQTVFWIAFAGFFFGLTYGLLQIVGELSIFRRERFAGVGVGAYVASKIGVLLPVLIGVSVVLIGVLRGLDRLPPLGWNVYALLLGTVTIEALSALALGLLASASVSNASQAALALPMLCFPQVLFAGGVVPVSDMATPGQVISAALANRHAFEGLGRALDIDQIVAVMPGMAAYADNLSGDVTSSWLVLAGLAVVSLLATAVVLRWRSRPQGN